MVVDGKQFAATHVVMQHQEGNLHKTFDDICRQLDQIGNASATPDVLDQLSLAARHVESAKDLARFVGLLNRHGVADLADVAHSRIGNYLDAFKALLERPEDEPFDVDSQSELAAVAVALLGAFLYE